MEKENEQRRKMEAAAVAAAAAKSDNNNVANVTRRNKINTKKQQVRAGCGCRLERQVADFAVSPDTHNMLSRCVCFGCFYLILLLWSCFIL